MRRLTRTLVEVLATLAAATLGVLLLEDRVGLRDGSALYLLAVALVAGRHGTWPAVATAVGAFLAYNYLFVPPLHTFVVAEPQGLLTLLVLLALGIGIGRLTGRQLDRARESDRREREARSLFAVSRALAGARRTRDALPAVVERIASDLGMARVWIGLGPTLAQEAVVADSGPAQPIPPIGPYALLQRSPDETRSSWVRLSPPTAPSQAPPRGYGFLRVELSDGTDAIGSLWAMRPGAAQRLTIEETRLLAATADQVGQGILRDRLAEQATELEVTRRSDALKAALLESVSHDLRTPLATIRAAAGTLADPSVTWAPGDREAMAAEVDTEAERMARLVSGLLDMSRIEGGAIRPVQEPIPVGEAVQPAVQRARQLLGDREVGIELDDDLPPLRVDPLLIDQVLANLLENAATHTPPRALVRISARQAGPLIAIRVEDDGPGVAPDALPRLFDKFYRAPGADGSRHGTGLGLAVVKGLVEAMGGSVQAERSPLGGLAVEVLLPAAEVHLE